MHKFPSRRGDGFFAGYESGGDGEMFECSDPPDELAWGKPSAYVQCDASVFVVMRAAGVVPDDLLTSSALWRLRC